MAWIRMRFLLVLLCLVAIASARTADAEKPVWLLGDNFHTSMAFRARDVPFRKDFLDGAQADEIIIGFGAGKDYMGPSSLWTILQAIFPNRGVLHVVPVTGPILRKFPKADVVQLMLSPVQFNKLMDEVRASFANTPDGKPIYKGTGTWTFGRFYASNERFYFPYVCNMWVAMKLNHAGEHFFLPDAVMSHRVILQAAKQGQYLQHHGLHPTGF
jgi:hypothetical protein